MSKDTSQPPRGGGNHTRRIKIWVTKPRSVKRRHESEQPKPQAQQLWSWSWNAPNNGRGDWNYQSFHGSSFDGSGYQQNSYNNGYGNYNGYDGQMYEDSQYQDCNNNACMHPWTSGGHHNNHGPRNHNNRGGFTRAPRQQNKNPPSSFSTMSSFYPNGSFQEPASSTGSSRQPMDSTRNDLSQPRNVAPLTLVNGFETNLYRQHYSMIVTGKYPDESHPMHNVAIATANGALESFRKTQAAMSQTSQSSSTPTAVSSATVQAPAQPTTTHLSPMIDKAPPPPSAENTPAKAAVLQPNTVVTDGSVALKRASAATSESGSSATAVIPKATLHVEEKTDTTVSHSEQTTSPRVKMQL